MANGDRVEVVPRVYRASTSPETHRMVRRAATLWLPQARLSHRTGGALWKFDGVHEQKVELTVTSGHPRHEKVIAHRSKSIRPSDTRHVTGLRVTSPELTIIDLAGILDAEALEIALESARLKRLLTVESVSARLAPIAGRGRTGARTLNSLLADLRDVPPAESPLEVVVARRLRKSNLPKPHRQFPVGDYRLDFAWPEFRVALECDGRSWHSSGSAFARDRARWSELAAAGWRIVFATRRDVTTVEQRVSEALRAVA